VQQYPQAADRLLQRHCRTGSRAFVDGNKRAAFFSTDTFLRVNGRKRSVDTDAAHAFIVGSLERGECSFDRLLPWVRDSLVRIQAIGKERARAARFGSNCVTRVE
jgi:prophage maintenance system killer protein